MNKDIKQLAEETLDSISKVNGFSDFGGIVLDYDLHYTTIATLKDVITVAMVEMYTAGAREATSLPLDQIINKLKQLHGYLESGETYCFDNEHDLKDAQEVEKLIADLATTTPLSSSSGDAPFNSNNSIKQC